MHFISLKKNEYSQINDRLRFAVGSEAGAYSDRWTVDVVRDGSFYATSKGVSRGLKLSIHPNVALWGFTQQAYGKYQFAGKLLTSARSPDRFCFDETAGQMRLVASICFPSDCLKQVETPWSKAKPSLYFPPASLGMAQVVNFSVGRGRDFPAQIEGLPENATIIGALYHQELKRSLYLWRHTIAFSLNDFLASNPNLLEGRFEKLDHVDLKKGERLGAVVGCERQPDQPIRLIEISGVVAQ